MMSDPGMLLGTLIERLTRYRVHIEREDGDPNGSVLYVACPPDPAGGWVRFTDVEAALATLPPSPPQEQEPLTADSLKFLGLLLSGCDNNAKSLEHSWQKCRRCLAVAELEGRSPMARKFIQHAIDKLAASPPAQEQEPPVFEVLPHSLKIGGVEFKAKVGLELIGKIDSCTVDGKTRTVELNERSMVLLIAHARHAEKEK